MKSVPVSVIIPCYNCADTIERAVLSVVKQTALPAEVIFINDASTDNTLDCLYNFQEKYNNTRFHVISLPQNQGPASARNAGWDQSTEPYLAFLDADDAWHPEKIHYQFGWMKKRPDVAVTSHRCIQFETRYARSATSASRHPVVYAAPFLISSSRGQMADTLPECLTWDLPQSTAARVLKPLKLLLRNQMLTRSVMLNRTLPYRFPVDKRYSEDYFLWLEMVLSGVNAWYLDIPLALSFKSAYGEAGLSRDLMAMEKGELDTFLRLRRKKLLSSGFAIGLFGFSLVKHVRRMIIHWAKGPQEL
jgi:glycosyltransferase involved in cell wall biosynthesis